MKLKNPPGPYGAPFLGALPAFARNPVTFFRKTASTHGGIACFRLGTQQSCLISEPNYLQHIFGTNKHNYIRSPVMQKVGFLIGDSMILKESDAWRARRKLLGPLFTQASQAALAPSILNAVAAMTLRWHALPKHVPFCVHREMRLLSMDVHLRAILGITYSLADLHHWIHLFDRASRHMMLRTIFSLVPDRIPLPGERKAKQARSKIHALVEKAMAQNGPNSPPSILQMMNTLFRNSSSKVYTDPNRFRDELISLIVAGYEPSASALTWIWYLLDRNPEVRTRLTQELDHIAGDRLARAEDLPNLDYLRRVILESLRIYAPGWVTYREALADDEVGGFRIRKGACVIVSSSVTHHLPQYWPKPNRFDPDRFLPEQVKKRHPFAYIAFGASPRTCIGKHLGMFVLTGAMVGSLRQFQLALDPKQRIAIQAGQTLQPKFGMSMFLKPRPL